MKDLEKQINDLETDVGGLVELLATTPDLRELFKVVPGHLQAARQVEGNVNAAVARLCLDEKSLEDFKADVDALVLDLGYTQGDVGGKNAEMRKLAEKAALAEDGASQDMARRVREMSYRLAHAESLVARAKNARRLVEDVSDAAYRLLRLEELEAKYEQR